MRTAKSKSIMELRKQIHDELRTQHPEWVELSGESPKCDDYEARLMRLLDSFAADQDQRRTDSLRGRTS
jgi:hypothetical protein